MSKIPRSALVSAGLVFLSVGLFGCPPAQDTPTSKPTTLSDAHAPRTEYSPYLNDTYPDNVYFGDTHVHTSYSTDAGFFGNRIGPEEAYRFAKGEEVTSSMGVKARLLRPLDFLVIADHAENLGLAPMIFEDNPMVLNHKWGKKIAGLVKSGKLDDAYVMWGTQVAAGDDPFEGNTQMMKTMWERIIDAAEKHNNPGQFTAFIGFEWTSSPAGSNLHRNVIFRGNGDAARKVLPFSVYDSEDPEDLWTYLAKAEQTTGTQVLAIAHNGNLSNGLMFDDVTLTTKKPIDRDYAERRIRWEPLYEVTQLKGDGEAHPQLSPNDEFADFETWDTGSFGAIKEKGMIEREYARDAFKRGMQYEEKLGVNPFKFGLIGSSDSHTSLATTTEDNQFSKVSAFEPSKNPERFEYMVTGFLPDPQGREYSKYARHVSASGLAAVWSRENTREALWDAMARKEVFATTGTRMKVRVFAGWDFIADDLNRVDFAKYGYDKGVPMGADLNTAPANKAPGFLIKAMRDPDWANLDRIQIVKGWVDAKGEAHERIYDVTVSGNRKIGAHGRCKISVGNTVNIEQATFDNSIGEPVLAGYWQDPQFDSKQRAFYYVRVLEIPTPRWTTYDAKFFGVERPKDVPASIQERAYTSPIWYTPGK
jgi:ribosome-associated protein YbcJ (S4-like RNA binding protein)